MRYRTMVVCAALAALGGMAWMSDARSPSALSAPVRPAAPAQVRVDARSSSGAVRAATPARPPAPSENTVKAVPELEAQRAALATLGPRYPRLRAKANDETPVLLSLTALAPAGRTARP